MDNLKKSDELSQIQTFDDSFPQILRDPDEPEDNFSIIPHELSRDLQLPLDAKGLLVYFLSFSRTWVFYMQKVMRDLNVGKEKFYRLLNILVETGYMKKEDILVARKKGGKFKRKRYVFSKLKKFRPCTGFPHTGIPHPGNHTTKNNNIYSSFQSEYKENKDKGTNSVHNSPPPKEASRVADAPLSADASEVYEHFLAKIRERKPDFKEPRKEKWVAELDRMLRLDRREKQKTKDLISWLVNDDFWFGNVMSPEKLRLQYDKLEIKMNFSLQEQKKEPNKKLFYETRAKNFNACRDIRVKDYGIVNLKNGRDAGWDLPPTTFADIFASMIGGTVRK